MQVKFRGKTESGEWAYGYLFEDEDGCFIKQGKRSHRYGSGIPVDPESVGMFTGLHDKNGNEIYGAIGERGGDIVVVKEVVERGDGFYDDAIGRVYYDEYHSAFLCAYEDVNSEDDEYLAFVWETKVVGIVMDNPELLEQ